MPNSAAKIDVKVGSKIPQKSAKSLVFFGHPTFLLCSGGDLNPHALRHTPLKRTCLPFHHPSGPGTAISIMPKASRKRFNYAGESGRFWPLCEHPTYSRSVLQFQFCYLANESDLHSVQMEGRISELTGLTVRS